MFEDDVVESFSEASSTSKHAVEHAMGVSHMSKWGVLQKYNLHMYHLQGTQALGSGDYAPCIYFARWFIHR